MTDSPLTDSHIYGQLSMKFPSDKAKELLKKAETCPVNFDCSFDHQLGTRQPPKVAYVPVELWEDLKEYLALQSQN